MNKGATPIVTGIMILVLSVSLMIIIVGLAIPFFNGLNDTMRYNNNKKQILEINEHLLYLNKGVGSSLNLSIFPTDDIIFDNNTNTITIKQELKKEIENNLKELVYNNLRIKKENNFIIFTLDLNNTLIFDKSFILNNQRHTLNFETISIENNRPNIRITFPSIR